MYVLCVFTFRNVIMKCLLLDLRYMSFVCLLIDLKYMFLVGGFAESAIVQSEIRQEFGNLIQVIIPQGVSMTILKGKSSSLN